MKYCILFFLVIISFTVHAQSDTVKTKSVHKEAPDDLKIILDELKQLEESQTEKDPILEIDGLLVDNTITKSGTTFYEYFYRDWVAPAKARNYTIYVIEKPYRMSTTMIEVKINETLVFQSYLQPRNEVIQSLSKQAVERTGLYLRNYEAIMKQLDGEDRSGSGIF